MMTTVTVVTMVTIPSASPSTWRVVHVGLCILTWLLHADTVSCLEGLGKNHGHTSEALYNRSYSDRMEFSAEETVRSTQVVSIENGQHTSNYLLEQSSDPNRNYRGIKTALLAHGYAGSPRATGVGSWKEIELFSRKDPRKARQFQPPELNGSVSLDGAGTKAITFTLSFLALAQYWKLLSA